MKAKDFSNSDQASLEQHFRQLRKSVLQEYEAEHKLRQELAFQPNIDEGEKRAAKFADILEQAGISLKMLQELDESERVEVDKHIKRMVQKLHKREPDLEQHARERILRTSYYNRLGALSIPLVGADRIIRKPPLPRPGPPNPTPNPGHGEWGDSEWFYPGTQTDIKVVDEGSSWNCLWAYGWVTGYLVFYFVYDNPPETTDYSIFCSWPYHGFYVLQSNDKWWTCRNVRASVDATLRFHQGYWHAPQKHVIFDKDEDNIHEVGVISGVVDWYFITPLIGGIPVTFQLIFAIRVAARIHGTRAELNFADGSANYVASPHLWVGP